MRLIEYRLSEKFGWPPDVIDRQDPQALREYITIMRIEKQLADAELEATNNHGR